ncbi:MAG: GlcG/HbpS family heme-binding protein [Gammaproteobacteria bacterium]
MANTITRESISYAAATRMVAAAISKAEELGCKQNAAVVDPGGRLVAFGRMDGAAILGIEGCQRKAFTALFGVGTDGFYHAIKDDPSLVHGLSHFTNATIVGGGLPIIINGEVVGGIGVGGASVEEDIACAQAGIDAL